MYLFVFVLLEFIIFSILKSPLRNPGDATEVLLQNDDHHFTVGTPETFLNPTRTSNTTVCDERFIPARYITTHEILRKFASEFVREI